MEANMKRIFSLSSLVLIAGISLLTGCNNGVTTGGTYTAVSGVAQKGPLQMGSIVTAQELDANLSSTGKQYSYQVDSDLGTFSPTSTFSSQYIGLSAKGYFFDEVTNGISADPISLNGISDLSTDTVLNVNLLTTLAYQRIISLVTESGMPFSAARSQAENEVLAALNIRNSNTYDNFGCMDISKGRDGDKILAAISSIFVSGNSPGTLSALIANFQSDIADNGIIDTAATNTALLTASKNLNLASVASNLTQKYASIGVSYTATDIYDWIDRDGDGVVGKFKFQVPKATTPTTFTVPSSIVNQVAGFPISLTGGQLLINGTSAAGESTVNAGDVVAISVSPASDTFPNGVLTTYLMSGTAKVAKITFIRDGWMETGSMAAKRANHTATLLLSGKVLVAGGENGNQSLASAEMYDPITNTWSDAGNMVTARSNHTATLLPNGKVLVAGGNDQTRGATASAELYDPVANTWSDAGSMRLARSQHTATLLPNGKILVRGQAGTFSSWGELYDSVTNTWSATGSMQVYPRYSCTSTLLSNGKVLVAGGWAFLGAGATILPGTELYDSVTNTWSAASSMATPRYGHSATLLPDGKVLVAGGRSQAKSDAPLLTSVELYDPATNTWSAAGSMSTARLGHTATLLSNGKVLVMGGEGGAITTAELYDPVTDIWSPTSNSLANVHAGFTATILPNGMVLVAGGGIGFDSFTIAELYYYL
jgi:N-acetylneuraminic acid mutarotase